MYLLKKLKIALSVKNYERIQSINSVETYKYRTTKDTVCQKNKLNIRI